MNFGKIMDKIKGKKSEVTNFIDEEIIDMKELDTLLTDTMWNKIFSEDMKTNEIRELENKLKEVIVEEQDIRTRLKLLPAEKKKYMTEIINLTPEKFDNRNDNAEDKMQECKRKIEEINEEMDDLIIKLRGDVRSRKNNLNQQLRDACVKIAYNVINKNRKLVQESEKKIEQTKEQLNILISEKNMLEQNADSVYQYIHGLLGPKQMEELDKKFLNND